MRAFEGVRVIDFSQVLSGPFCTAQLALLGADVIKIEQPGVGDQARGLLSDERGRRTGISAMFVAVNAGKRAIAIDLKHARAKAVVFRLIETAHAVVQNFRPGVIDRLGFGYEAVRAVNPAIVYGSVSGFGQRGPKSHAPAYDGAIQAISGMMSTTGHVETGPTRTGAALIDMATGMTAAFALASALYRQKATGEGQHVDVAMLDTALAFHGPLLCYYMLSGVAPELFGNGSMVRLPTADSFPTKAGDVLMSVLTDAQTKALCAELGRPDLLDDPRFASRDRRMANHAAMRAELVAAFATDSAQNWETRLADAGVPIAEVSTIPKAIDHPQLAHRGVIFDMAAPKGFDAPIKGVGTGFIASEDGPRADRPPPAMGEHTDSILAEAGYGPAEIGELKQAGIVA